MCIGGEAFNKVFAHKLLIEELIRARGKSCAKRNKKKIKAYLYSFFLCTLAQDKPYASSSFNVFSSLFG